MVSAAGRSSVRNTLVAALAACADSQLQCKARRFLTGLSSDELQFIAEFLGACILESGGSCRIAGYRQGWMGISDDQEHKVILLREFLCRSGIQEVPMPVRAAL